MKEKWAGNKFPAHFSFFVTKYHQRSVTFNSSFQSTSALVDVSQDIGPTCSALQEQAPIGGKP